jgi:hypothetical protein
MHDCALSHYAFYCSPAGVRIELKNGADPNLADAGSGMTPLMWLCDMWSPKTLRERKRIFRYLVEAGGSLTQTDAYGATALDHARNGASRGFRSFVRREYQRRLGRAPRSQFKMDLRRNSQEGTGAEA